jgi:putative transcriptional regulator
MARGRVTIRCILDSDRFHPQTAFSHGSLTQCLGTITISQRPLKNRLKVLRAENDWSQARLASELGVSRQTVNAIETSKYDPSLPLAFDIAKLFGKKIEEIFFADLTAGTEAPERGALERAREKKLALETSAGQLPFPELDVSLM